MTAKELLKGAGINTYQELASRASISKQRAYQIWSGETRIGHKIAGIISEALNINRALLLSVERQENGR